MITAIVVFIEPFTSEKVRSKVSFCSFACQRNHAADLNYLTKIRGDKGTSIEKFICLDFNRQGRCPFCENSLYRASSSSNSPISHSFRT